MKFRLIKILTYNMEENNNSIIKAPGIRFDRQDTPKVMNEPLIPEPVKLRQIKDFTTFEVSAFVPSTDAATATLYPVFYVATVPCFLLEAKLRHDVNGGAGATIDVERLINTTAKGSGRSMLKTKFNVSSDVPAAIARTTISTGASIASAGYQLDPGDAVALRATGTLTSLANVAVTLLFGINLKDIPTSKASTTTA